MIQEPSVDLAVQLLDKTSFRPGGKTLMSVSPAKFEQKGIVSWLKTVTFFVPSATKLITDAITCVSGDVFIAKKTDKQKKRKTKKVEDKMLGWGNLVRCFWVVIFNHSCFRLGI
jgi:HIV Tat-specific factor 1